MGADNAWLSISGQPLLSRAMPVQNPAGPCNLGSPSVVYTLYLDRAGCDVARRLDRTSAQPRCRTEVRRRKAQTSLQHACNMPATSLQLRRYFGTPPVVLQCRTGNTSTFLQPKDGTVSSAGLRLAWWLAVVSPSGGEDYAGSRLVPLPLLPSIPVSGAAHPRFLGDGGGIC
jgi:hypothetical protein